MKQPSAKSNSGSGSSEGRKPRFRTLAVVFSALAVAGLTVAGYFSVDRNVSDIGDHETKNAADRSASGPASTAEQVSIEASVPESSRASESSSSAVLADEGGIAEERRNDDEPAQPVEWETAETPVPVVRHVSGASVDPAGAADSRASGNRPNPAKSRFSGKILDYRVVELPPREKGEKPGELHEWLIEPDEGYTAHIEEEYRPAKGGEMQVVDVKEYVANQVLLTLDGETDYESFKAEVERSGAVVKEPLMELEKGGKIVAVMAPDVSFEAVEKLMGIVADCDMDLHVSPDPIETVDKIPNDARYSSQWGLVKIQAPSAWDVRTDASSTIVAVIDSGVNYNHADLAGNMWVRNSSAAVSNFKFGMKCMESKITGDPLDDNGHGSHCAGIIGAVGNNSTGVSGVAWKAKIMACKSLSSSGSGSVSDRILCMEWARTNGAAIVSMSLGAKRSPIDAELQAFQRLRNSGIIAVCAAGNDGDNNETYPHYPSSYALDNIVAVAASTESDSLASFSCYGGTSVDIAAPGVDILSTVGVASYNQYESWPGTSMATPYVAGTLALLKAQYPSYTYLQLIQKLYAGGDAVSALSGKVSTGKRLNVYKSLSGGQLVSPTPTATLGSYSDRVVVSWPSVSGATHYRVYRAATATGAKTALGSWQTGTTYQDTSVSVGTTYYYWVCAASSSSGANQSAYGAYAAGYAQAATGDAFDPGDDTPLGGTAIVPTTSRQTHGPHSLGGTDTNDFFRVSVTAGKTYVFETTGTHDTVGELYDSPMLSNCVAYNDDIDYGTDRNFRIEYTPPVSGVFYLRVRNLNTQRTASGTYSLAYRYIEAGDAWDSGDDTPSGGTALTPSTSEQTHGPHTLSPTDLYDFFRISMMTGRTYVFESTGSYDMFGELFNSTSTNAAYRVAYNDDGGDSTNFKLEYTPTVSQTYYLRVRRYAVGADGTYSLKYSYRSTAQYDIGFCNYLSWPAPFVITSSTNTMEQTTTFYTNQTIWLCYQVAEANLQAIPSPVTNWVQVVNQASGAECYSCMWIHDRFRENTYGALNTQIKLNVGAYTARMALNEDGHGNHGVAETTYTNNVRTLSFTVVNPQKTLNSIAISGNSSIASKGTADYRCIGTYSDGSTADVSPIWSLVAGSSYATVSSSGRVTAGDAAEDRTVTLQAVFGGKSATKSITIRGTGASPDPEPKPFDDPVPYPSAPMIVEGVVYVNNVLAAEGDQIAAYAGNEVRGVARVVANGRVTMGVNLAEPGERISFKVWDASEGDEGTIYNCLQSLVGTSDPQGTPSDPVRFDAAAADPFGPVTPEPLVPPTIIEASVTVDGAPASSGDILAVFSGNAIVGKAPISYMNRDGRESATCRPVMFFSGRKTLSFRLWDADKEEILEASATLAVSAGDVTGSVSNPHVIAFASANDDVPCPVSLDEGWNLVSFSVLPETPTPANVFAQVADSVQYVSDASGNLWGPAFGNSGLNALHLGEGYWVRSSSGGVTWNVEGRGNVDTEISLASGWNLVGYTLPRAGQVANVLGTALASGKIQYITDQSGNVYPGGGLSTMRPGVGYWVRATEGCAISFDRTGMETAAGALSLVAASGSAVHPFAAPAVRMGVPTVFQNMSVSLFGKTAAFGDYLAVIDRSSGEVVSVQPIRSEDGTLTFTIMGLRSGDRFYFQVWNSASGLDSPEIFTSASANDLVISNPDNPVVGYRVAITGTAPSFTVRYDLAGKATRTGGGALTQTVAFGGNAVDPAISVNSGWQFVDWDYSKRTDIRGPMTITALYEAVSGATPTTSTTCSFEATGGSKTASLTLPGTSLSFSGMNATSSASWCSATISITGTTLYFHITASANTSSSSRTATLTKVVSGVTYTVNVTQSGTSGGSTGKSDLAFYTPSGWQAPAFVASSASSKTPQATFSVGSTVYVSFAYVNDGVADAGAHTVTVALVDSSGEILRREDFDIASCSTTDVLTLEGYEIGTFNAAGSYTVYVILDVNDDLDQSDTSNDATAVSFTVTDGSTPTSSLNDAVDNYAMTITTGGSAAWSRQTAESYDGVDAARSGTVSHGQQSWMEASGVSGEGILSFRWKVSSEAGYDWIEFYIDGEYLFGRSGTGDDWRYEAFSVGSGNHAFAWVYEKDGTRSSGMDCAWVDQVKWTPNSPLSPVYRFYSPNYRGHFFTMDLDEMAELINTNPNWRYEGVAYFAYPEPASGLKPLYRFYSKNYRGHFYTMDEDEMWTVRFTNPNWKYEGIAYYIKPSSGTGATPIYRFWSKGYRHHFYTASYDEMMNLRRTNPNWAYENIAFYAWMTPDVLAMQARSAEAGAAGGEKAAMAAKALARPVGSFSAMADGKDGFVPAFRPEVAWLLETRPDSVAVAPAGETDLGDVLVETRFDPPDGAELQGGVGAEVSGEPSLVGLSLRLPGAPVTRQSLLWSAVDGTVAEEAFDGTFDFDLPADGVWHWLRAADESGNESVSVWLRAMAD